MVLGKRNTGDTGDETTHLRKTMLNHTGVLFACHVRFLLRGGEDSEVGKLVGFYKDGLAVFMRHSCLCIAEYPEGLWGWLMWIDILLGLWSFASKLINITLLQITLRAVGRNGRLSALCP